VTPRERLTLTWTAPPQFPTLHEAGLTTLVVVRFDPIAPGHTRVRLRQLGWGSGPEWDAAYEYFQTAWDVVLHRLQHRFRHGPVDWATPPPPAGAATPSGRDIWLRFCRRLWVAWRELASGLRHL
jgi:hypothetical protein